MLHSAFCIYKVVCRLVWLTSHTFYDKMYFVGMWANHSSLKNFSPRREDMLKVERISVMNFENALRGARNPMNSWARTDSYYDDDGNYCS